MSDRHLNMTFPILSWIWNWLCEFTIYVGTRSPSLLLFFTVITYQQMVICAIQSFILQLLKGPLHWLDILYSIWILNYWIDINWPLALSYQLSRLLQPARLTLNHSLSITPYNYQINLQHIDSKTAYWHIKITMATWESNKNWAWVHSQSE